MPLLGRGKTDEQKADLAKAKEQVEAIKTQARERDAREAAERQARVQEHVRSLPKWEYQVKRVGEDKQKGLLGSQRMEQLFNGEGAQGWELVAINEERATFKRLRAPG